MAENIKNKKNYMEFSFRLTPLKNKADGQYYVNYRDFAFAIYFKQPMELKRQLNFICPGLVLQGTKENKYKETMYIREKGERGDVPYYNIAKLYEVFSSSKSNLLKSNSKTVKEYHNKKTCYDVDAVRAFLRFVEENYSEYISEREER
jgi:hypothetical protein